jgi:hypothetical protein
VRTLASAAAVIAATIVVAGCAGPDRDRSGPEPTIRTSTTDPGSARTRTSTATPTSSPPGSATDSLLLARQVRIQEGGDGIGPTCRADEDTPEAFRREPGVWVNTLTTIGDYPDLTVLCLRGFSTSAPVDVHVVAGGYTADSTVLPTVGSPVPDTPLGYEEEPATTLFQDGAELRVYTEDYGSVPLDGPPGTMVSEMWQFVPPGRARDAISSVGSFTLTATQGGRSVAVRQPVGHPSRRASYTLSSPAPSGRLVLLGYPEGADVPIGLYREEAAGTARAELVRQVATVRVPASRVATFTVPGDVRSGLEPGRYCVLPPLSTPVDCETVHTWPDYPGPIAPGDRGDAARTWQQILIEAGVMSDRPENRDGYYGPATQAAVRSYLSNVGEPDGPSQGVLGRHAYALLTGIVVPS